MTKCLVAVACGEKYIKQTNAMVSSFLVHNPGWSAAMYYDDGLDAILPPECRGWSAFNRCEIGRWLAMEKCLEKYGTVLYCDGDIRWYDTYQTNDHHHIVLYPHYVTCNAQLKAMHWIWKDGAANLGMLEISQGVDCRLFDFIVGEVLHRPDSFHHKDQLWLQNIASVIPDCGFDAIYNLDPGYDVAIWNMRNGDRSLGQRNGKVFVSCAGSEYALRSFHFSGKSLHKLPNYGPVVARLVKEYLDEQN